MFNYLIALAIAGATSFPASVQSAPTSVNAQAATPSQPAKPRTIKKLVCEDNDNPYSHISRVCHTVEVPAQSSASAAGNQPAGSAEGDSGH